MKRSRFLLLSLLIALVISIYTLLVRPRRFRACLPEVWQYFRRANAAQPRARFPASKVSKQARLLVNGSEALPAVLELLDGAYESIRWQVMLFYPDETGRLLAAALARAARRGVRVQLSFNIHQTVFGTVAERYPRERRERQRRAMQTMLTDLREAGVEVRDNPARVDFPLTGISGAGRAVQQSIQDSVCIPFNHYDHRKLLIVDDRLGFIGGMNVGSHYMYQVAPDWNLEMGEEARRRAERGLPEAWEKWLDAGVIVEGPLAQDMAAEFNWRWEVLGGRPVPPNGHAPPSSGVLVQFLTQRPGHPQVGARYIDLVNGAREEIWVACPFVSYDPALEALQAASRRGVRVIFIYPYKPQEGSLTWRVFRESADDLLRSGVELYFNDLRMAHTKLLVVDRRQVLLGSFNLNHRSFRHDLETAVVVEDEAFARETIDRIFQPYLSISRRVTQLLQVTGSPINWLVKPFS